MAGSRPGMKLVIGLLRGSSEEAAKTKRMARSIGGESRFRGYPVCLDNQRMA